MIPTSVNIIILPFVIECLIWPAISSDAWKISSGISGRDCHINVVRIGISKNSFCQKRLGLAWFDLFVNLWFCIDIFTLWCNFWSRLLTNGFLDSVQVVSFGKITFHRSHWENTLLNMKLRIYYVENILQRKIKPKFANITLYLPSTSKNIE